MAKENNQALTVIEINPEFKDLQIGYNGSIAALKDRTDYDSLMDIALNSQDPSLLKVFKTIPTNDQWLAYKGVKFVEENPE